MKHFVASMLCLGAVAFAGHASAAEPAKFHIGICTGTVSQSEDDLRGAEAHKLSKVPFFSKLPNSL